MYSEDHLLMISALQHLVFCERQCALIHVEQQWAENRLTVLGELLHDKVHTESHETRKTVRTARSLRLVSYRLGLTGQADVVEFRKADDNENGIPIKGTTGNWRPYPIEYKKGKAKKDKSDEIQLCAQAICLEEQLQFSISEGALFYGSNKRRKVVKFDKVLRDLTETCAMRLHYLVDNAVTPPAFYNKKCDNCSLYDICNPKWSKIYSKSYYEKTLFLGSEEL